MNDSRNSSNQALPRALMDLIEAFANLPGVGARTAERYALACLKHSRDDAMKLSRSLAALHAGIKLCPVTFALIDADLEISPLYAAPERNRKIVAVVEEPFDVVALENTGQFRGTYHVLGGAISPIDGVGPEQLHIPELIARIISDEVEEVILATNASVEGESTALFIQKQIEENLEIRESEENSREGMGHELRRTKNAKIDSRRDDLDSATTKFDESDFFAKNDKAKISRKIKITRLARGLPIGVDLEYADQITLSHALNGRREL